MFLLTSTPRNLHFTIEKRKNYQNAYQQGKLTTHYTSTLKPNIKVKEIAGGFENTNFDCICGSALRKGVDLPKKGVEHLQLD